MVEVKLTGKPMEDRIRDRLRSSSPNQSSRPDGFQKADAYTVQGHPHHAQRVHHAVYHKGHGNDGPTANQLPQKKQI